MPFQVSPGVNVSEIDLTTIVPAVSTTEGAIAGVFRWGPALTKKLITTEDELVAQFGKPTSNNYETWFTASNFLAYGNKLYVVRTAAANAFNAVAGTNSSIAVANTTINNEAAYENFSSFDANTNFAARYPGMLGNSLKVSVCSSVNAYSSYLTGNTENTPSFAFAVGSSNLTLTVTSTVSNAQANAIANTIVDAISIGDIIRAGNSTIGFQDLKVASKGAVTIATNAVATAIITLTSSFNLSSNVSSSTVQRYWEYYNFVDKAPGTSVYANSAGGSGDEMHMVIADEDGQISGTVGQVLEVYKALSRASDAKTDDGSTNFWYNVVARNSKYVYPTNNLLTAGLAGSMTALSSSIYSQSFRNGYDGVTETTQTLAGYAAGYDLFADPAEIDISLVLTGKSQFGTNSTGMANYIIDNVCEVRKDCVAFVSPNKDAVVNNAGNESSSIVTFRNSIHNTSYAVLDSGYKYQYDKYNDAYRWIPLNGDIAGLCVRTDSIRDPWFSPAGFNRGQVKNVVKLAYNPNKGNRDILYKSDINPVVNFPGEGTILFGDKTLLGKPSAFDRINVRRLFIVIEKAIATAAKFTLFELNDSFTRASFRNLIEPYLRDVKGRRGIYDFKVVCDETNNTPERIDRNEFWGDIYVKPARSINFIQLNFIAVRTGVTFDEIVGKF